MTDLEQIKDRIDIIDLIQGYVRLQKAGMNYKALCPFHNEKTPSFMVSPERQIWHCFGCGAGGDHFKFLTQIEGIEFPEALRILAKRAGVEIKGFAREAVGEKTKLCEVSELAAKFFEKQLWESEQGKKALKYLKERGLKDETIKEWRLGYAPDTWTSLRTFLKNAGYSEKQIAEAGLAVKRQNEEGVYDRFRGRIMFPISDLNSQVVGFTGRVFEEVTGETEMGKYINTPQTLIYDKSRILYGLDKAKAQVRKSDRALVVEGNTDVIMSHQAGVKNAVASSGTALTDQHLKIIKRYTQNLDLCFDQDLAGETAAKRGINLALARGLNVGIVNLSAKDPADLAKDKPEEWVKASAVSQPIIKFYIDKAFEKHDPSTALGKKKIAAEVLPVIKLIDNKVEQSHWLEEFAVKLRVEPKIIVQAMAAIRTGPRQKEDRSEENIFEKPSRLAIEETLLALLIKMPQKAVEMEKEEFEIFTDRFYNNLFAELKRGTTVFSEPPSYEDKLRLELVKFKSEQFFGDIEPGDLELEISRLIKSIKKELILEKIKDLELKIKEAKSESEVSPLLREVNKFSNKLATLT